MDKNLEKNIVFTAKIALGALFCSLLKTSSLSDFLFKFLFNIKLEPNNNFLKFSNDIPHTFAFHLTDLTGPLNIILNPTERFFLETKNTVQIVLWINLILSAL